MFKKILAFFAAMSLVAAFAAVDINKGTEAELDSIKGIGPAKSKLIVAERKKSEFKSWEDFISRVKGIGETSAAKLSAEGLTVGGASFKAAAAKADAKAPAKDAKADAKEAKMDAKAAAKDAAKDAKADSKAVAKDAAKDAKPAVEAKPAAAAAAAKADAKQAAAAAKADGKPAAAAKADVKAEAKDAIKDAAKK